VDDQIGIDPISLGQRFVLKIIPDRSPFDQIGLIFLLKSVGTTVSDEDFPINDPAGKVDQRPISVVESGADLPMQVDQIVDELRFLGILGGCMGHLIARRIGANWEGAPQKIGQQIPPDLVPILAVADQQTSKE